MEIVVFFFQHMYLLFFRYSELDRLLREKDIKLEQLKQSYQELEDKWQGVNDQCFQLRQQQNEKQREHEHIIREKDASLSTYVHPK